MNEKTKRICIIGMLCAVAYLMVVTIRIPIALFLKYEPKDVVITIGGLIFGPMTSLLISLIVSLVEMFTISDTGIWGFVMNVLATCAFSCTAAWIYKKKRTIKGAVIGLLAGCGLMVALMLLWNYLITPIYMGYPREAVAALLVPVFLPFNLFKGGLNAAITLLLYKPIVSALRKASLLPASEKESENKGASGMLRMLPAAAVILATSILILLVMKGVI
jgi:riboflavin transporter FmnP